MHDDDGDGDLWFWTAILLIFAASEKTVSQTRRAPPRWRLTLLLILWLVGSISVAARVALAEQPGVLEGRVVGVSDGDTLTVLVGREQHRVRLAGIDAPEQRQPFGQRAKQALSALCFGDTAARVRIENRDRFGRLVGRVECRGQDANAALVEQGYAWVYTRYNRDSSLPSREASARAAGRGLWADPGPIPPWDFRRQGRR